MEANVFREMAAVQGNHWWFVARGRILATVINRLSLSPESKILEIGCGTGGNLAMLSRFGQLSAMEYDEHAREIAEALDICKIEAGGLPEPVPFDNGQFDLVCLLDVLEHIENDDDALVRIGQLLGPTGRLLITVPAYSWLWSAHDEAHHHHRRYTAQLLRDKAQQANLVVDKLCYFNTFLFPLIALVRLIGKVSKKTGGSDAAIPSPLINYLLKAIFSLERYVITRVRLPFGTSVMAVLSTKVPLSRAP